MAGIVPCIPTAPPAVRFPCRDVRFLTVRARSGLNRARPMVRLGTPPQVPSSLPRDRRCRLGRRLRSFPLSGRCVARAAQAPRGAKPGLSDLCQNPAHGAHLVRTNLHPAARQGRRRRERPLPGDRRADRPRHHRRRHHLQPSRRRAACGKKAVKISRDGGTAIPTSLEPAFVLDGPGEYEVHDALSPASARTGTASAGAERGRQTAFVTELDGLHTIHLGDIGHELTQEKLGRHRPRGHRLRADRRGAVRHHGRGADRPAGPQDRGARCPSARKRRTATTP